MTNLDTAADSVAASFPSAGVTTTVRTMIAPSLGPSPSKLADDASAAELQESGYELTDFAGAFTPNARFGNGSLATPSEICGSLNISPMGRLRVTSGDLVTFDPRDKAYLDASVRTLERRAPLGEHPVWTSSDAAGLVAALVHFGGAVVDWTPARVVDSDDTSHPTEPANQGDARPSSENPAMRDVFNFFDIEPQARPTHRSAKPFRSHTRFSVGLTDARTMSEIMTAIMTVPNLDEVNRMRALFNAPPLKPGEMAHGVKASPTGTHPDLEALRNGLDSAATADANGIVAFTSDVPVAMFWGLDADRHIAALVCDFERLRIHHFDIVEVSLQQLQREISVEVQGLTLRDLPGLGSSPEPIKISGPATARCHSVSLLLGEARTMPSTKERRRYDGSREIEVDVSSEDRRRGTLRIQLEGASRPARRILAP